MDIVYIISDEIATVAKNHHKTMYGYELSNECDKPIAKATPEKLEVS